MTVYHDAMSRVPVPGTNPNRACVNTTSTRGALALRAPPPKKLYSARTTVTSFHPQPLSAFKALNPDSRFNSIVLVFTGCDPFPELKSFIFSTLFNTSFTCRVVYTAISQFDTFPTRPSLSATTHTLSLWSLIIDIHTFLAWLSS